MVTNIKRSRISALLLPLAVFALVASSCSGTSPSDSGDGERIPSSTSDEQNETVESPDDGSGEDSELRLVRSGTDAFVPESAHSAVAARYGPTTGNFTIPVYYCAEEGKYTESDLAAAVQTLNDEITPFFSRVSSGELEYNFVPQKVVSPEAIPWDTIDLKYIATNLWKKSENPCFIEAIGDAFSDTILVLADIPAGSTSTVTLGYAIFYGGPSIVVTEERHEDIYSINSRERYLQTVAHELGHSLLDLCHTHQASTETGRYNGKCLIKEDVKNKRYDEGAFQDYHNNYIFDKDDISVMSYQFAMSVQERNSYTLGSDYISCRQLYTKELDLKDCNGAEVIDPDYLAAPLPPEPEGSPPDPPSDLAAAGLDGTVVVKWSPPLDNGGSPLTGYRIEYSSGSTFEHIGPTSNHTYVIDGLTNGVEYRIGVRAENEVGTSEAATVSATPQQEEPTGTLPGPVVSLTATGADREVRVSWSPPSDDGGSALTGYSVLYRPTNGEWERWPHSGTPTNAIVTGLAEGTEYEIEITARNIVGHGRSEYARASTPEDQCDASTSEHRHASQNVCHSDHPWSDSDPPPCVNGQARNYTYHDPNDNDRHISRTVTACPDDPELSAWRGGPGVAGDCTSSSGCEWVHGSGSGWTPGAQFWIRCGTFVDTQQNRPVNYYDTFVDSAGNLEWGDRFCVSNFEHSVEVWTNADGSVRTVVQAPDNGDVTSVPGRPTVGATVNGTTVEARWSADDNGSRIERWQLQGPNEVDFRPNADITNYVWRNLAPGRYTLRVRAENSEGWSQWGQATVTVNGEPVLRVWRGGPGVAGDCTSSSGCEWVHGSGSRWPAGEQFWISCGTFVNTQQNDPVPYHDRFVDSAGNLEWGDRICLSNFEHSVEVWTSSGVRKTVTVQSPEPPVGPELSVRRGSVEVDDGSCPASVGCRWIVGSGSGWPAGEQFWISCGTFVNTQQNRPVNYRDRFVDSAGNLEWGESICYTANRTTVEVWTSSGVRKTVTFTP